MGLVSVMRALGCRQMGLESLITDLGCLLEVAVVRAKVRSNIGTPEWQVHPHLANKLFFFSAKVVRVTHVAIHVYLPHTQL